MVSKTKCPITIRSQTFDFIIWFFSSWWQATQVTFSFVR